MKPKNTTHSDQLNSAATRCQTRLTTLAGNRKLHLLLGGLVVTALALTGCHELEPDHHWWS